MDSKIGDDCNKNKFFNAVDEELPFEEDVDDDDGVKVKPTHYSSKLLSNGLLRRRYSSRFSHQEIPFNGSKDSNFSNSRITHQVSERITPNEQKKLIFYALNDRENLSQRSNYPHYEISSEIYDLSLSFLFFIAGLGIKAINFQISLFISFFTFPIWFFYSSIMFMFDPFRILNWARKRTIEQFVIISGCLCEILVGCLKQNSKILVRFGWGFFWSAYVCFLLFGFLVLGFVIGGVTMRYVVEEPIQITETLNFDYTKSSPVALVPIISCPSVSCGVNCTENVEVGNLKFLGSHIFPSNHKSQLAVSLALPESEYNRKLGVFQVRVDFLSVNGKVTASSSYPCMLQFKSQLIRNLETFLKSVPLLTGYSSESQTLNLKMRGLSRGNEPTSCLKVILEQRAEYRPGTGIPEIYTASLVLDSELSLIKRIIWNWKKTMFIWASMVSFMLELMLILVCCRPVIIPRPRRSHGSAKRFSAVNAITWMKGN